MGEDADVPEVRPPTIEDVRRICRALDEAGARYVLIGGFAVVLHGGLRTTKDVDLLVDPSPENVELLKRALGVLEDNAVRDVRPHDLETYTVVRVADEVMVDLLAAACGVTWSEARPTAHSVDLDGVPVIVADRETLIRTKQTIRPSDAADRAWLEASRDAEERAAIPGNGPSVDDSTNSTQRVVPGDTPPAKLAKGVGLVDQLGAPSTSAAEPTGRATAPRSRGRRARP